MTGTIGTGAGAGTSPNTDENVPRTYSRMMETTVDQPINPGQLNKIRLRPMVLNEHAESSREAMDVVEAANIVGQVFKASQDNINTIGLTLESAATLTDIDLVEQANDAALQLDWVASTARLATLDAAIKSSRLSSTKSMTVPMTNLSDKWTYTKAAGTWDMSNATIEFDYYQNFSSSVAAMTVSINDGVASSVSAALGIAPDEAAAWKHFSVPVASLTGTADASAITNIFFTVSDRASGAAAHIDNVQFRPEPGSVDLKLWDCGSTLPVADGASFDLTTDASAVNIGDLGIGGSVAATFRLPLKGGQQLYHVHGFAVGTAKEIPANVPMTPGNYYALTINYVDTDVTVYGPDTSYEIDYYQNGYAFFTSAENADIAKIPGAVGAGAYSDLMFQIYSTDDIYIRRIGFQTKDSSNAAAQPGADVEIKLYSEDADMRVCPIGIEHRASADHEEDLTSAPLFMEKGGKAEIYYSAGVTDDVVELIMELSYYYKPPTVNG
jgi:hypothetical protein